MERSALRCPGLFLRRVFPMLSNLGAILHGKEQLMLSLYPDGLHLVKEHILVKGIHSKDGAACFHQLAFRGILGIAPPELIGLLPGADPGRTLSADFTGVPQLSGVVPAAASANNLPGEWILVQPVRAEWIPPVYRQHWALTQSFTPLPSARKTALLRVPS